MLHARLPILLCIQAHIPRHQTPLPAALEPGLGIHDAGAALSCLHKLRVLLLEDLEVALGLPVPDGVGGEDEIHFLEGALVGFGVEGPDDEESGDVDGAEEVEGFFVEGGKDCGEEEDLSVCRVRRLFQWGQRERKRERGFDAGRGSRGLTYRPPIPNGPTDHAPCVAPGTDFQGENLGRVQPWNGQPSRSEDGGEEEDEEYSPATHA